MGPNEMAFLVVVFLEATIGLLSSFFMIICLYIKGFQKKNMMTYSKILIPLNVSNISYTIFLSMNFITGFLLSDLLTKAYVFYTLSYMTLYSITSSMWLAAVLCVFYFMKIMPSQTGVLTTLKSRIGAVVWWLIITSEVVSLGGGCLSMLSSPPKTNQGNSSLSMLELMEETNAQNVKFMLIVLILNSLPLLTIIMTTIGSAGILKLYDHQIQKNMTTSGNTRVRDYREAIQTMIGLLALYSIILLCTIIMILNVFLYPAFGYCLCVVLLFSVATVQPSLLIYGNPRLKEAIKQVFTLRSANQNNI